MLVGRNNLNFRRIARTGARTKRGGGGGTKGKKKKKGILEREEEKPSIRSAQKRTETPTLLQKKG